MTDPDSLDWAVWLVFALSLVVSLAVIGVVLWAVVELVSWVTAQ